jgi:general secretion pathway protein G
MEEIIMTDEKRYSSCSNSSAGVSAEALAKAGFTLVEILLVMVIIGVLAGVVVVQFGGRSTEARINATRSSIAAICTAVDLYEVDVGKYPSGLGDLTTAIEGRQPALKRMPMDSWGNAFALESPGPSYIIRSSGPDEQVGSEDDITN